MEEQFRKIDGYDFYEISNYGTIINTKFGDKQRKLTINKKGYYKINLSLGSKRTTKLVHCLVADTFKDFVGEQGEFKYINHKDGNKLNNRVDNLKWSNSIIKMPEPVVIDKKTIYKYIEDPKLGIKYKISSLGKIYMITGTKFIFDTRDTYGENIRFTNELGKKSEVFRLDLLIANAFPEIVKKGKKNNRLIHIDGHECNNCVDNLQWIYDEELEEQIKDEIFVQVTYSSEYEISNYGTIRRIGSKNKILPYNCIIAADDEPFCIRGLWLINGKSKSFAVHRLVAEHFLDVPNNKDTCLVVHLDQNKHNNYYKNLQWMTPTEFARWKKE